MELRDVEGMESSGMGLGKSEWRGKVGDGMGGRSSMMEMEVMKGIDQIG